MPFHILPLLLEFLSHSLTAVIGEIIIIIFIFSLEWEQIIVLVIMFLYLGDQSNKQNTIILLVPFVVVLNSVVKCNVN